MSQRPLSAEHIIARPHRFFTLRSILLGLMGVIFINALTPYNDYALNNAPLVGNNLPLGVVVLTWLFMVLISRGRCRDGVPRRRRGVADVHDEGSTGLHPGAPEAVLGR